MTKAFAAKADRRKKGNNIMKKLEQTDGVKYRLTDILNAQLTDILLGYRFIYIFLHIYNISFMHF